VETTKLAKKPEFVWITVTFDVSQKGLYRRVRNILYLFSLSSGFCPYFINDANLGFPEKSVSHTCNSSLNNLPVFLTIYTLPISRLVSEIQSVKDGCTLWMVRMRIIIIIIIIIIYHNLKLIYIYIFFTAERSKLNSSMKWK
jgi:hypothetical protein